MKDRIVEIRVELAPEIIDAGFNGIFFIEPVWLAGGVGVLSYAHGSAAILS